VAYEPNSLGGGCPFQAGAPGFMSFAEPIKDDKVRGKPEKFAEHYNQAKLFWNSQTDVEKNHIIGAYRFELTKVQVAAVRTRVVAMLRNVAEELAHAVADGLGMELPAALPKAIQRTPRPEVDSSASLSLFARAGTVGIATRRIALLIADGVKRETLMALHQVLTEQGAVPRFVGLQLGRVQSEGGDPITVEISMETAPSVLWDAVVLPDGEMAVDTLSKVGRAMEFLKDQYRHCKPILVLGAATALLDKAGIPATLPSGAADPGLLIYASADAKSALPAFAEAVAKHRHFLRETNPPLV
jgi:catalase